jgi:hypothetical protein
MQRAMEFIVGQQAQFAANIQRLEEERIRDTPRLARLEDSFQALVQLAQTTDVGLDRVESSTDKLESSTKTFVSTTDMLISITDRLASTTEMLRAADDTLQSNMTALAAAQAHADQRLSTLIDIVLEDRNGRSN